LACGVPAPGEVLARRPRFVVRAYRPGDEHAILTLWRAVWCGDAGLPPRSLEHWRWQFADWPWGMQVVVAELVETGEIVAHYCGIPTRIVVFGREALATHNPDSMVHPAHRQGLQRQGPFLASARAYYEAFGERPGIDCNFGFPNRAALRVGVALLGYLPVTERMPALHFNLFADPERRGFRPVREAGMSVVRVREVASDADALWRACAQEAGIALVRDRRYLSWRYGASPAPCVIAEARDARSTLRGLIVLRAGWQRQPILAILDLLAPAADAAAVSALLEHALELAFELRMGRVEGWGMPASGLARTAQALGFALEPSEIKMVVRLPGHWPDAELYCSGWRPAIGDSDID
jgi:hypothetical protein